MNAAYLKKQLQLEAHPEGGHFRETYRAKKSLEVNGKERNLNTLIYFMLEADEISHFHRIKSDEIWYFHSGEVLEIIFIENGKLQTKLLGSNLAAGESFQAVIPANTWFAAKLKHGKNYALVSCSVAPGFDFEDFELAKQRELTTTYPNLSDEISKYCLE